VAAWCLARSSLGGDSGARGLLRRPVPQDRQSRGEKRAAIAVAHSLLTVIYHVLSTGTPYYELGALYFGQLDPVKLARYHLRRLAELGYELQLDPRTAA